MTKIEIRKVYQVKRGQRYVSIPKKSSIQPGTYVKIVPIDTEKETSATNGRTTE